MKKIIYIILLSVSASLIISSCTEESVAPKTAGVGTIDSGDKSGN